jgi:hypothetical protein
MHRVRTTLPFIREFGFEPEIVAVDPRCLGVPMDSWLEQGIPRDVTVHRCSALSLKWGKIPGLGTLAYRAKGRMRRLVDSLLSQAKYDLIYFSTTVFGLCALGPYWKRKFGVPFVVDYQDPWVSDYYKNNPHVIPPGGRLKYGVVQWLAHREEPCVIRECAGLTSVSPAYPEQLRRYYPEYMRNKPTLVAPFPGAIRDFERVRDSSIRQNCFRTDDSLDHWVYIGRGGDDMAASITALLRALQLWKTRDPNRYAQTRIHFIGTSYAPAGKGIPTILPTAKELGVDDIVSESTDRVCYSEMLKSILDAQALIVLGSNDPGYTASKLYPYLLARRPMLSIFHRSSSVVDVIRQAGGSRLVTFDEETKPQQLAEAVYRSWFEPAQYQTTQPLNEDAFETYIDLGSAKQLCMFFHSLVD